MATTTGNTDNTVLAQLHNVTVIRDGRILLHDITLKIQAGKLVSIVGPNGGGKTTLLKTLIGADHPTTGEVYQRNDLCIGYQPQRSVVTEHIPLTANDFLHMAARNIDAQETAQRLASLSLDAQVLKRQIAELSGGERQRVMIARAMLRRPDLLALDEPGTYCDQRSLAELYACIEDYCRTHNCAALMVSHDISRVLAHSDHVYCVNQTLVCEGGPDQVLADTEFEAMFNTHAHTGIYRHRH